MASLVGGPFLVHRLVDARQYAQDLPAASIEADVRADRVHHVDTGRLAQLPWPRLEGIRLGSQRADRAEIDDIAGEFAGHRAFEIAGDLHVLAAADRADLLDAGDLLGEADAAGALDAAGHD